MSELQLDRTYRRGDTGRNVRLIQEWLSLHGYHVKIDGDFGPATEATVRQFRTAEHLPTSGEVDAVTFERLVQPMKAVLAPINPQGKPLGELVLAYAEQHLRQQPREIGGQNCGPWVRLYMGGHEGEQWPWCAGFVCFCLKQACDTLRVDMPLVSSCSCDYLAASAETRGRLMREPSPAVRSQITAGSIFLNRRTKTDWTHTGIVVRTEPEVFRTIEGNTNDEGSHEGYEVCARLRDYSEKDFIII